MMRPSGLSAGPPPPSAAATLILVHGRGADASSILALYPELRLPHLAAIAPQASGNSWYPHSFLAPLEKNQPQLDGSLAQLENLVSDLLAQGIPASKIALLGFSQGACLAVEFVARNPRRYGAAMVLTGGLIGPPGTPRDYSGSLAGTPIFLGAGDPDPHVPFGRVKETQAVLARMHAAVELRRYPGMPHTISADELAACRTLLSNLTTGN